MIIAVLCLLISFIPALLLYRYLRNLRRDDAQYRQDCRRLLGRGLLCSVCVAAAVLVLSIIWGITGLDQRAPLLTDAFHAFVLAALVEELVKYVSTNSVIRKNSGSVSWLDCIAYAAIVGIGFQLIETVVYMIESSPGQILVRGFTMGHPSYGMLMGYFIGKALYTGKRSCRAAAFGLPFLLHGLYDFSLADGVQAINDNLVFLPFISIIIELTILIRILLLIRKERHGTKYTEPLLRGEGQDARSAADGPEYGEKNEGSVEIP